MAATHPHARPRAGPAILGIRAEGSPSSAAYKVPVGRNPNPSHPRGNFPQIRHHHRKIEEGEEEGDEEEEEELRAKVKRRRRSSELRRRGEEEKKAEEEHLIATKDLAATAPPRTCLAPTPRTTMPMTLRGAALHRIVTAAPRHRVTPNLHEPAGEPPSRRPSPPCSTIQPSYAPMSLCSSPRTSSPIASSCRSPSPS